MSWRMKVAREGRALVSDVWRDGCSALSRNICELIRAAGHPVTKENVLLVLLGLPAGDDWPPRSFCRTCLTAVATEATEGRFPTEQASLLLEYFSHYLAEMRLSDRSMLTESLCGVLEGLSLDWELPLALEIEE